VAIWGGKTALNWFVIDTAGDANSMTLGLQRKWLPFCKHKVEVKLSLFLTKYQAIKTYLGSGGIAPLILVLGTRRR